MGSPQAEHNLGRWRGSLPLEKTVTRREKDGLGEERMRGSRRENATHETKVALLEVKTEGAGRLSAEAVNTDAPLSLLADLPKCSDDES